MHALREEFPVEDDVTRLEPRVARIEGELTHLAQLNSRLAGVEVDLRDLRKSVDQSLDRRDIKLETKFENLVAKIDRLEARFEKLDSKLEAAVEKLDAKIARLCA